MVKKEFRVSFLPYDYEEMERFLSEKSAEGWQLRKAGEISWTFVQGERNEFQYQVTYIPEASEYHPEPTEHELDLDTYCAAAGWEHVCNYRKIQIYRNRNLQAVLIDTDESQKLQMMHRAVKKWQLLPAWLMIAFFGLLFVSVLVTFFKRNDSMTAETAKILLFPIIFLLYKGIDVINYNLWYRKSLKNIAVTGKCYTTKYAKLVDKINKVLFLGYIMMDTILFNDKTKQDIPEILFFMVAVFFYNLYSSWIKCLCRYNGWLTAVNRVVTFCVSIYLSIVCSALFVALMAARGFLSLQ